MEGFWSVIQNYALLKKADSDMMNILNKQKGKELREMKAKVLIVDDDPNIADLARLYLEKESFEVKTALNGATGLDVFHKWTPDIVLLDIMMPVMDGWELCRQIRKASNIPVIMISARGETFDKVLGLELGADDYIVKPFEPRELMARIKAVLRRSMGPESASDEVVFSDLVISKSTYTITYKGKLIDTPPKELELLYFLASHPDQVFTREQLLEKIWGYDYIGDSRTVDVHIKRLRDKFPGMPGRWEIRTIWGVGYKFEVRQ
jgi:DNA-binding response OmpR family regulator